jgi:cellulose synthase/poly-beta-1,6-N-acetylglucosamine synthase-like glycosyltransferase
VRLSSRGAKVVVAYDAAIVTREETPGSLTGLLKQRTRWNQGFLQVLRKGEWRRLPTFRQRMLARYTLSSPFLQAVSGLVIPVGIGVALWGSLPVQAAMLTFLPVVPMIATLAFQAVGLHEFARQYGLRLRVVDYLRLVLGAGPYMLILAAAALRAVWREATGRHNWELTRHVGAHLATVPPESSAA